MKRERGDAPVVGPDLLPKWVDTSASQPEPVPASRADQPQLPADDVLQRLNAGEREALLVELATRSPPARGAMLQVLEQTSGIPLRQTLETAAVRGSLGTVCEAVGLEVLLDVCFARNFNANDVLATTDSVTLRGLTTRECVRILENFDHTLDPRSVRYRFTTGLLTMGAGAMVVGNVIHVDPTDPRWGIAPGTTLPKDPDDDQWNSFNSVLLAHEPTHVWSYQHQGSQYALNSAAEQLEATANGGSRNGAYTYLPTGPSFWAYGEEQRAMIVQDFVTAQQAKRHRKDTTYCLYAGLQPPDEVLTKLGAYIKQMRGAGPGQARPAVTTDRVVCPLEHPGFQQDGALDALAHQADALIAEVGREAKDSVVEGLARRDAAKFAVGAAGIAAAAAASVVSREQNVIGGTGGGSAVLDEAQLPHGVSVEKGGVTLATEVGWSAPAPNRDGVQLGFADAHVDSSVKVRRELEEAVVSAELGNSIGLAGSLRDVHGAASVEGAKAKVAMKASVTPQQGDAPFAGTAELEVTSEPLSVTAKGALTSRDGVVQSLDGVARLERGDAALAAEAHFRRGAQGLELKEASLDASLTPSPALALQAGVTLVPKGLDRVEVGASTLNDFGTLAASVKAQALTTKPTVGVAMTATEKKHGVSVTASAQTTPSTGETQVGVGVTVPFD